MHFPNFYTIRFNVNVIEAIPCLDLYISFKHKRGMTVTMAHIHKTLCIRLSYLTRQVLTVLVVIGFIFLFSDVTIQAVTEFTEEPILRLETGQHTAAVNRISVDGQQRFLVSGSADKTARVYDIKTGRLLQTLRIPIEDGDVGKIYAVAISPDGSTVAIGGWTGKKAGEISIYLLERNTGKMIRRIGGLPNCIVHLTNSPDGRYLAAMFGKANGIRIYETRNYQQIASDTDYGDSSYWCSFDNSNRLVTTSWDGYIRLYNADFKLVQKKNAPGGSKPFSAVFSPGGQKIAVGYNDSTRVDVLSANDLKLLFSANTDDVVNRDLSTVTWSTDGRYLYAGGRYNVGGDFPIRRWDKGGRGAFKECRISTNTIMDMKPLADGRLAVGTQEPLVGVVGDDEGVLWKHKGGIPDFRDQRGAQSIRLSKTGDKVLFGFEQWGKSPTLFSLQAAQIMPDPPDDKTLLGPITEAKGMVITDWVHSDVPKLNGNPLALDQYEWSRSLAISPDDNHFLLGTEWFLRCFDRKGNESWRADVPGNAWSVNISGDGRLAVAGLGDGTLRWYRMTDGKEILALFVRPDDKRWILWTPQGYYCASVGGEDLIGWHFNNGADKSPDFFGASRFRQQFYRPDVIAQVIQTLDVDKALQLADNARGQKTVTRNVSNMKPPVISILEPKTSPEQTDTKLVLTYKAVSTQGEIKSIEARVNGRPAEVLDVDDVRKYDKTCQSESVVGKMTINVPAENCSVTLFAENKNGVSEPAQCYVYWKGTPNWYKPKLYVLAIGVTDYKDSSYNGLKYCAKDAGDFVEAVKKQKQEDSLYQKEPSCRLRTNYEAETRTILNDLKWLKDMTTSNDVAMVFLSGHGEKDPENLAYRFLPHDANPAELDFTTLSECRLAEYLRPIKGKVILFLDTCYSGVLFSGKTSIFVQPDTIGLVNEFSHDKNGIIVFASCSADEPSKELEKNENGLFTSVLIKGIKGQADFKEDGRISIAELWEFLPDEVKKLTDSQTVTFGKPWSMPNIQVFDVIQEKKGEGKK